ncbi:DUF1800 family protein [soil metagenome]
MNPALVALNRFGLGARPGEAASLGSRRESRDWLMAQVGVSTVLRPRPGSAGLPDRSEAGAVLRGIQEAQRGDPETLRAARAALAQVRVEEQVALLHHRATTETPFAERLVGFWSNHLCVSFRARQPLVALAGLYEREAIRPHIWGSFSDMVLASAQHPAMLIYLDNARSTGPDSALSRALNERRSRRQAAATARGGTPPDAPVPGINENHARELLELHTLGVEGGYTQTDVGELARILTGWSVGGAGAPPGLGGPGMVAPPGPGMTPRGTYAEIELGFVFRDNSHEPGAFKLLGRRYDQPGAAKGEAAVRDLCRHPSTARFVSGKLAAHFISDDPPVEAVDQLAEVFLETGGDLAAVSRALVQIDAPWGEERGTGAGPGAAAGTGSASVSSANPGPRKFRSPQDWAVAALRLLEPGARTPQVARALAPMLDQLRHPVWGPPAPSGFGDRTADWADPNALMNRAELARSLAQRLVPDGMAGPRRMAGPDAASLASVVHLDPGDPLAEFLADASIPIPERVALLLGGPAFQWR